MHKTTIPRLAIEKVFLTQDFADKVLMPFEDVGTKILWT